MPNDLPDWTSPGQTVEVLDESLNAASANGSFNLPAGTQSLIVVTVVKAGDTSNFGLTGASSLFGYYGQQLGTSAYEIIGVDVAVDPVVNWTAQSVSGPGVSWHVTASPAPPPTFITRTPATWQVPQLDRTMNVNIAPGGTFTWATPPAGEALRLFHTFCHWRTSTAGFGRIQGSGASGVLRQYDQVATNFWEHDFRGRRLAVGETLQVINDDVGSGQSINGGIGISAD